VQHREFHRILHVESPFSSLGESHVGFWPTIETVTQVREACSLCTKIYSYRGFFTVTVLIAFNGIFFPTAVFVHLLFTELLGQEVK
jgi:hypothetical protein